MKNIVKKVAWPFLRYCVLIPQQMEFDVFEWLYINLIIYQNQCDNRNVNFYDETMASKITRIVKENFSEIIDDRINEITIDKIQKEYVSTENGVSVLNEKAFEYLNTYENLFSNNLTIKYFYQDQVSGVVFPYFYDSIEIEELNIKKLNKNLIDSNMLKKPSKRQVDEAYKQYIMIQNIPDSEIYFDKVDIEKKQKFENNDVEENESINYTMVFLNQPNDVEFFEVDIFIEDGEIKCSSPFDEYSNLIMNKVLAIGRNVSPKVHELLTSIEKEFLPKNDNNIKFYGNPDFASSLKYFSDLYRMIENINDEKLRNYVKRLDEYYILKRPEFYSIAGIYVERLLNLINYEESSSFIRSNTNRYFMQKEINDKLDLTGTKANFKLSDNIFYNWKNKFRNNKPYDSFSGNFADVIYKSNLTKSSNFYDDFIDDVFEIYNNRSKFAAHDGEDYRRMQEDDVAKIKKITKVFLDVIEGREK